MDLRFTPEETAFREEVRAFFRTALPVRIRDKLVMGHHASKDELVEWTRILNAKGWAVPHWPVEWGGTGWDPVRQYIFQDEMQQAPAPSPLAVRRQHGRAGDHRLRLGGAEAPLPAAHRQSRRLVVPGLLRARLRLRPRLAQDHGEARRRRLRRQRPEDLDDARRNTPTGSSCSSAPTWRQRSRRASPSSSST